MSLCLGEKESMSKIRVLLVEDHEIVRKGLRSLLDQKIDIEVIDEAADGIEALKKIKQLHPDMVIMDISMPSMNGLEATRRIKKRFSDIKVLILTMHCTVEYIHEILKSGASGYVVKQSAPKELFSAIEAVQRGDSFLSPSVSKKVIEEFKQQIDKGSEKNGYNSLTEREREILQLIAEGRSNREIAKLLFISVKTVDTHRANLTRKLGLHGIADIIRYAIHKKIIDSDSPSS